MSTVCRNIRTPNPSLLALAVSVDDASLTKIGGLLPSEGTLFSDAAWRGIFPRDYMKLYGGFKYLQQLGETKTGIDLLFARTLTDAQRGTPFRTITKYGNHYWHPVLKALEVIPDENTPRSYNSASSQSSTLISGPSFYVREDYIPAATEGTRFLIEEFFSDVPYEIPQYPAPTPSSVSYDFPGVRGGFPECLHGDIEIQAQNTASNIQILGTAGNSARQIGSGQQGQFFPRTGFTDWAPYVLSDEQQFNNGYHRTKVTVFPPIRPKLSIK